MLPIVVAGFIPLLVLIGTDDLPVSLYSGSLVVGLASVGGIALVVGGLVLLLETNRLFVRIGKGTLAPWAPPNHLVVAGPYRYTRNPMILGVLTIILGESMVFSSAGIFLLFLVFFVGNQVYFLKSEEPGLVKRFGEEYLEYASNVPRWIPRRTPWEPGLSST
jgi:protein-S-isoprenylcysteine O-methyltransferase Ste14